jgi:hypothetical protein
MAVKNPYTTMEIVIVLYADTVIKQAMASVHMPRE